MARVNVLDENGDVTHYKGGTRIRQMHQIDADKGIKNKIYTGVYTDQKVDGKPHRMLTAIRPCTAEDRTAIMKAKQAKIKAEQKELDEELAEVEKQNAEDESQAKAEKTADDDKGQDSKAVDKPNTETKKKPAGRGTPNRAKK